MEKREPIRDFYGRIIGYICTFTEKKDKIARDFYGRILGFWDPELNVTRDFYRKIIARGDVLSSLIVQNEEKNKR